MNLILKTQKWDKDETLVVGDMNVDILMGKRSGTATCGVTYGNGSVSELEDAGADYIVSDFSNLIRIVECLFYGTSTVPETFTTSSAATMAGR